MDRKPELNNFIVNNRELLKEIKEALLCLEKNSNTQKNPNTNQLADQTVKEGRVTHEPSLNEYIAESRGLLKEVEDALLLLAQTHDNQESLNAIRRAAFAAAARSRNAIAALKRSQLRVISGGLAISLENAEAKHGS